MRKILITILVSFMMLLLTSCYVERELDIPAVIEDKRNYQTVYYIIFEDIPLIQFREHYEFTISYNYEGRYIKTITNVKRETYEKYQVGDIYYIKIKV